jgi:phosphomannomutase
MLSVSGCRGVVGESLTPEVACRFAGAYGRWLRARAGGARVRVVVGRDGRAGGQMVHAAALAGLMGSGCHVIDIGVATTPTTAIATDAHAREAGGGVVAGMVLTASHNPQQWNGLKCLLAEGGTHGSAACAPPATCAEEIIALFHDGAPQAVTWERVGGSQFDAQAGPAHVARVLRAMKDFGVCASPQLLGSQVRVAVDSVNGSGSAAARAILDSLGCSGIEHLNNSDSGIFPHPPEPTEENLSLPGGLCEAVRARGCHVGFAQDPDADRLALVDEQGRYVGEEYTLALGVMALLEAQKLAGRQTRGLTLVTNLSTSRMLDDLAAKYGAAVMRTPVGEANVVETMKAHDALAGGEGNGGLIWPRVCYVRDSLAAMSLVVWLMSPAGGGAGKVRPLSGLVAGIPAYAIRKRKVEIASREEASPAVAKIAAAYKDARIDLQDGVRVDWDDRRTWLHVRASNTEPIMRLIAEAPTMAEADKALDAAARVIAG